MSVWLTDFISCCADCRMMRKQPELWWCRGARLIMSGPSTLYDHQQAQQRADTQPIWTLDSIRNTLSCSSKLYSFTATGPELGPGLRVVPWKATSIHTLLIIIYRQLEVVPQSRLNKIIAHRWLVFLQTWPNTRSMYLQLAHRKFMCLR